MISDKFATNYSEFGEIGDEFGDRFAKQKIGELILCQ